jgi:hypothetical protein
LLKSEKVLRGGVGAMYEKERGQEEEEEEEEQLAF